MAPLVLFISGANAVAAVHGLIERDLYASAGAADLLWLRVGAAAVWALVWAVLAVGLWLGQRWARLGTIIAFWAYALSRTTLWATNALTTYEQGRWLFVLITHLIAASCVLFLLTRPDQSTQ